jgi:hypothetical protein
MQTVYDFVTVICFILAVLTYFMFTQGGMRVLPFPASCGGVRNRQSGRQPCRKRCANEPFGDNPDRRRHWLHLYHCQALTGARSEAAPAPGVQAAFLFLRSRRAVAAADRPRRPSLWPRPDALGPRPMGWTPDDREGPASAAGKKPRRIEIYQSNSAADKETRLMVAWRVFQGPEIEGRRHDHQR